MSFEAVHETLSALVQAVADPLGCSLVDNNSDRGRRRAALDMHYPATGIDGAYELEPAGSNQPVGPMNVASEAWRDRCAIAAEMTAHRDTYLAAARTGRLPDLVKKPVGVAGPVNMIRAGVQQIGIRTAITHWLNGVDSTPALAALRWVRARAQPMRELEAAGVEKGQPITFGFRPEVLGKPAHGPNGEVLPPLKFRVEEFHQGQVIRSFLMDHDIVIAEFQHSAAESYAVREEFYRRMVPHHVEQLFAPAKYVGKRPPNSIVCPELQILLENGENLGTQRVKIFVEESPGKVIAIEVAIRKFRVMKDVEYSINEVGQLLSGERLEKGNVVYLLLQNEWSLGGLVFDEGVSVGVREASLRATLQFVGRNPQILSW